MVCQSAGDSFCGLKIGIFRILFLFTYREIDRHFCLGFIIGCELFEIGSQFIIVFTCHSLDRDFWTDIQIHQVCTFAGRIAGQRHHIVKIQILVIALRFYFYLFCLFEQPLADSIKQISVVEGIPVY